MTSCFAKEFYHDRFVAVSKYHVVAIRLLYRWSCSTLANQICRTANMVVFFLIKHYCCNWMSENLKTHGQYDQEEVGWKTCLYIRLV